MPGKGRLERLAKLIRYYILISTTEAGSGHPSSSLSAVELMTALLFGGAFRFHADRPDHPNNDRLLFSKGHAAPLLYALWAAAGRVTEGELLSLRKFGSPLEGHPSVAFPYTEAATGSLGQGLSIGLGMALNAKYIDKLPYKTYVLLGDSEAAEGSVWEAAQLAAHYCLDNLIGILDVNRLGQRGETMYGHDLPAYAKRFSAFGWKTVVIDGHSLPEILDAYGRALLHEGSPYMIIARTTKGKGVSFIEDRENWHGKTLKKAELTEALKELGPVEVSLRGEIADPEDLAPASSPPYGTGNTSPLPEGPLSTRRAYGHALADIFSRFPGLVVLDAEVGNSTCAEIFRDRYPERFFEMYVAEQNMAGVALGLARQGKIPFVSTFAAFLSRAYDQVRMSQYSRPHIVFTGSHAGVSIGEDGPSQMGLEDIALFRALMDSVVLYPSDAVSTVKLVEEAARHHGIVYLRTTRMDTPVLYGKEEIFPIGGSKVVRKSGNDAATVVTAGVTLHEALAAYEMLKKEGVSVRVIDLYCIKPLDRATLGEAVRETGAVITVEDHYAEGGMGEAVCSVLAGSGVPFRSLAVRKMPRSGRPGELLEYEEISRNAIVRAVKELSGG